MAKAKADTGKTAQASKANESRFEGFLGTRKGSFFKSPEWVDLSKPPGYTDETPHLDKSLRNLPYTILSGMYISFSPNGVWLIIALLVYFAFPYSYDMQAYNKVLTETGSFWWAVFQTRIWPRIPVNLGVYFAFAGFWHVALYWKTENPWATRPFNANRVYKYEKVIHNMFYSFLGVIQWSIWEGIVVHCYATGRIPYLTDEEAFTTIRGFAIFVAGLLIIPLWRGLHFYFAHRFIHIKFLYKYVHSLHHRNTDIEPFAGLSMHPIEHIYYYACFAPALYMFMSPAAFHFNGMHLLLSPAASHSGFEDNWQSDQYHYLHHRFFECNYGDGFFAFDRLFGTFRESLNVSSSTYKGEHVESKTNKISKVGSDSKATLLGLPTWDEAMYNFLCCCSFLLVIVDFAGKLPIRDANKTKLYALLVAFAPIALAAVMAVLSSKSKFKSSNWRYKLLYPFNKESIAGLFGGTVLVSTLFCVVPTYHAIQTLLSPPGEGIYFFINSV